MMQIQNQSSDLKKDFTIESAKEMMLFITLIHLSLIKLSVGSLKGHFAKQRS